MPQYLKDVRDELRRFGRNHKDYAKYRVTQLQTRGSTVTKTLSYKVVVTGETNNYAIYIQFFKVEFSNEDPKDPQNFMKLKTDSGDMWYRIPTVKSNPVNIKCSCPDFRFRFEKQMYDNDSLIGNWRRYTRKTPPPPVGLPYANPKNLMGFCKHISSLLNYLFNQGLLKE